MHFKHTARIHLTFTMITILVFSSNASAGGVLFVDDDAGPGGDGTSWETAYRFLQDALTDASGGGFSEIHVAQGTYKPDRDEASPNGTGNREATFHLLNGVALMGGYAGIFAKDPNARDIELFETILSGDLLGNDEPDFVNNDENSYHVTIGSNVDANSLLEGFTITAGNANGLEDPIDRGGGYYATSTDAKINLCKFELNFAALFGGGIYSIDGSYIIINSVFIDNKVDNGDCADGGGIALRFGSYGSPEIMNCVFTGNSATHGGAGLKLSGSFKEGATIDNCIFEGNTVTGLIGSCNVATGGGGMFVSHATDAMQITNCTFTNNILINTSGFAVGGGLALSQSNCHIVNSDFRDNSANGTAGSQGGAIEVQFDNPLIINCTAIGNSADSGGGFDNLGADPIFANCTITGNTASVMGGAVHSRTVGSQETLLTNCNIWDNGLNPIVDEEDAVTTVNYSNVQGGWTGAGSNNIDADPMFVNARSGDYRLSADSPCIDAANSSVVPEDILTDLDGNSRFIEDPNTPDTGLGPCPNVDMGAYEFQDGTADCCTWDLDGSGCVGTGDLLALFAQWGTPGSADFDDDGTVGTSDLLILFANWGPCE